MRGKIVACVLDDSGEPAGEGLGSPWYAIHVRSNFEQIVFRQLQHKGYELFLPTCRVERRWSDRVKQLDVPLFPGYVFCRLDQASWLPILTTPGVIRLVSNGRKPLPITNEEIASVQTVVGANLPCSPWPSIPPGSPIIVGQGPLMGVQGVLVESRNGNRLVVSIGILNRAVAVEIDARWVHALADSSRLASMNCKTRVV